MEPKPVVRVTHVVERMEGRQYAEWYHGGVSTQVAIVEWNRGDEWRVVNVYCDGRVRFVLMPPSDGRIVRSIHELADYGVHDDASLDAAYESGVFEYDESAYFDLYDEEGDWLNAGVTMTYDDAIEAAVDYVNNSGNYTKGAAGE